MSRETVDVVMRNRRTTLEWPFPDDIKDYFKFEVQGRKHMPLYKAGHWDGTITMMRGSDVPTGLFRSLRREIEDDLDIRFRITDRRHMIRMGKLDLRLPRGLTARDFQGDCVENMRSVSNMGGIVLGATGAGKTLTVGLYARSIKGRLVFVVDELTLLYQAQEELEKILGQRVGVIGEGNWAPRRVTVCTIQTLDRHKKRSDFEMWCRTIDVVVIDELHLMINKRQQKVVEAMAPPVVFGLTATLDLHRSDVRYQALSLCGPVCFRYGYTQGRDEGHLAPGVVVGANLFRSFERNEVKNYNKLYKTAVEESDNRNNFIEDVAREGIRRGRYVVILVRRVAHVGILSHRLRKIPHMTVTGAREVSERIAATKAFERGKIRLIIANDVFKKGINIKRIDLIIEGASGSDDKDAMQKFGRGARLADQKDGLIYVDVGDKKPPDRPGTNPFDKQTKSRREVFIREKIPMTIMRARDGGKAVLDEGEYLLQRLRRKLGKSW